MIIFLQNAWSPVYAGSVWPRKSWLRALASSRSGQRLKLITEDWEVFHNAAPICGNKPSSVIEPDVRHIQTILESTKPDVVVACGKLPEAALRCAWKGPLLCLPHPAHRVLTNDLYIMAAQHLRVGIDRQYALRQERGRVVIEYFE